MVTQSKFIEIDKDTEIRSEHQRLIYVERKEKIKKKEMTDNTLFWLEYKKGSGGRGVQDFN